MRAVRAPRAMLSENRTVHQEGPRSRASRSRFRRLLTIAGAVARILVGLGILTGILAADVAGRLLRDHAVVTRAPAAIVLVARVGLRPAGRITLRTPARGRIVHTRILARSRVVRIARRSTPRVVRILTLRRASPVGRAVVRRCAAFAGGHVA